MNKIFSKIRLNKSENKIRLNKSKNKMCSVKALYTTIRKKEVKINYNNLKPFIKERRYH